MPELTEGMITQGVCSLNGRFAKQSKSLLKLSHIRNDLTNKFMKLYYRKWTIQYLHDTNFRGEIMDEHTR